MPEPQEPQSWDDKLRSADPFRDAHEDIQVRTQIFQEITMNQKNTQHSSAQPDLLQRAASSHKKPNRYTRPLVAMSSAAAVVAVALLGFSLASAPSASAQMLEAAQNSVSEDEGEIVVTAQLEAKPVDGSDIDPELASELGVVEGTLDFDFDGDNYSFDASIDDGDEGFSPQARLVDGTLYGSESGDAWFALDAEESNSFAQLAANYIPGVQNFNGEALEQLVILTDDVTKTESDGVVTYSGMVETSEVLALGADELPAVLLPFQLAEQEQVPLPTQLKVEMVIINDIADVITVSIDEYEVDGVTVSGTVTTDYSGVGEPQEIVAPPAEAIQTP